MKRRGVKVGTGKGLQKLIIFCPNDLFHRSFLEEQRIKGSQYMTLFFFYAERDYLKIHPQICSLKLRISSLGRLPLSCKLAMIATLKEETSSSQRYIYDNYLRCSPFWLKLHVVGRAAACCAGCCSGRLLDFRLPCSLWI